MLDVGDVVRGHDDGAPPCDDTPEHLHDVFRRPRVEIARRFVGQYHARIVDQCACHGQTLLLALCGLFFACIIGLVVGLMSVVKNRACNIIATIFVDVIRGVPMIVLAFYVFFAVPMLLNNIMHLNTMLGINTQLTLTALQAGTICRALNCGAYMAEIIRAGIESVDKGQMMDVVLEMLR